MSNATATFDAKEFYDAATIAKKATQKRAAIPFLAHLRLDFNHESNKCTIQGTDLDVYIAATVDCVCDNDFSFLIEPDVVIDFMRQSSGVVKLTFAGESATFETSLGKLSLQNLFGVENWQNWPKQTFVPPAVVASRDLYAALNHLLPCINEEGRYYLNGAYFHEVDGLLCAVATDGYRLAKFNLGIKWGFNPATIHTKTLRILGQLISKDEDQGVDITIDYTRARLNDTRATFKFGNVTIHAKCVGGTYPDYRQVIPAPAEEIRVSLSREVALASEMDECELKICPEKGELTAQNARQIFEATFSCSGNGPMFRLAARYINDFLDCSPTIEIMGKSPTDPFLVIPEDPRCLWVVMPVGGKR